MKNCFNFETTYTSTDDQPKFIEFETSDDTYWTMSEEWICEEEGNIEQILTFRKENYNYRRYLINIEITSLSKEVSGKATFAGNAELRETMFTVPTSAFDVFKYSSHPLLKVRRHITDQRLLKDAFRYKVIITRTDTFDNNSFNIPNRDHLSTYSDQLHSLLYDGKFSDIRFSSSDSNCIPAHRTIMAARSHYFFYTFKQINADPDKILDVKVNIKVLWEMLRFMYTGQIRPMGYIDVFGLYIAATANLIPSLEIVCHDLLVSGITLGNVSHLLIEADKLHLGQLKDFCIRFIAVHFDAVRSVSTQWQVIETDYPALFNDVLLQFS